MGCVSAIGAGVRIADSSWPGEKVTVNLERYLAPESLARPVSVVPRDVQGDLPSYDAVRQRDENLAGALVLQRANEPFDERNASVLADSTEAGSSLSSATPLSK